MAVIGTWQHLARLRSGRKPPLLIFTVALPGTQLRRCAQEVQAAHSDGPRGACPLHPSNTTNGLPCTGRSQEPLKHEEDDPNPRAHTRKTAILVGDAQEQITDRSHMLQARVLALRGLSHRPPAALYPTGIPNGAAVDAHRRRRQKLLLRRQRSDKIEVSRLLRVCS